MDRVQLEHIWVEAAIDYVPSCGAKNRAADAWVALDASFKQYDEQEGLDTLAISGIDAEALAESFTPLSCGWSHEQNRKLQIL